MTDELPEPLRRIMDEHEALRYSPFVAVSYMITFTHEATESELAVLHTPAPLPIPVPGQQIRVHGVDVTVTRVDPWDYSADVDGGTMEVTASVSVNVYVVPTME
ncbi:hypothetical protein [Streptomyces liangshanensis]|uniref:hypothetical protein n=1 Tax=Streptomyces liangshanensis TaxID=2717324 RepID=UPI0036D90D2B